MFTCKLKINLPVRGNLKTLAGEPEPLPLFLHLCNPVI